MEKTPLSLRTHITIFGNTNSGKSSLFNKIIGQEMAIVSEQEGTTTDPVTKAMELIGFGPVALTDTAGWGDTTQIGDKRQEKTNKLLDRTDFAVYTADITAFDRTAYEDALAEFDRRKIPHMLVFTKSDLGKPDLKEFTDAVCVSVKDDKSIEELRNKLIKKLTKTVKEEKSLLGGLLLPDATVVLVIPIDSEAPKGRLILPQVQLIRDCLDNGMRAVCVRDTELAKTLDELKKIDLVVTDSQIFKKVSEIVPERIKLTSFSMLLANAKGDIKTLSEGAKALDTLPDKARILMAEACTHNTSHEDIGRVKIPGMLRKYTGKELEFEYSVHHDFPDDLSDYDLVIHCGGCMLNAKTMQNRIEYCKKAGVPVTNYGVVLSYASGILTRSMEIFDK
ncbi:MAG: [Clostridia bacterium]|nr:[FeFe] hydrogenase H-cluster maturation GTPase HydF [Clostridia bacterium]